MNNHSRSVLLFCIFAFLPVLPIFTSFYEIRKAVVFDQPILWEEGKVQKWLLPDLQDKAYEFRLESDQSKWDPIIKANWQLISNNQTVAKSAVGGQEWNIFRPFYQAKFEKPYKSSELEIQFLNNPIESHSIRLKVSLDRGVILEKHTRLFIILLAFSLGFIVLIWKPFLTVKEETVSPHK